MEEIGLSYIPDNFYYPNEIHEEEKEKKQKEVQEQTEFIIKNVSEVINKITSLSSTDEDEEIEEEKVPEFVPGITRDRSELFKEYRTNFQNNFFHYLEKDIFDDTKKLLNNSFLFNDNRNARLLNYDQIELLNEDLGPPMSMEQIEALPMEKYPKKDIYDEKCILCGFNIYYNDSITKLQQCQHIFHKECFSNFLIHKQASKCPICKISLI